MDGRLWKIGPVKNIKTVGGLLPLSSFIYIRIPDMNICITVLSWKAMPMCAQVQPALDTLL